MNPFVRIVTAVSLLILLTVLTACTGESGVAVTPSEQDLNVLEFADPVAQNIMDAVNANDYAAFSRDFDPAMLKAIGEDGLKQIRDSLNAQVGDFQSLGTGKVSETEQGGVKYIAVEYPVQFVKAKVTLRLVFTADEPHKVSGLFFR